MSSGGLPLCGEALAMVRHDEERRLLVSVLIGRSSLDWIVSCGLALLSRRIIAGLASMCQSKREKIGLRSNSTARWHNIQEAGWHVLRPADSVAASRPCVLGMLTSIPGGINAR